ncbi:2,3,4,5-tetrahydropyridine-2,6-dicarboxylate N-acetyltransferase [Candidatus Burarchaeum australiense]|nr:2,3,4,5-tetrahydropyridine-2,6-dicarboxylate N-acetyltransferase [Candidatus Burarchaeum australiense]
MRRLEKFKTENPNSMAHWWKVRNPVKILFNTALILLCRYVPSLALKSFLYRLTGMKVGKNVGIGLGATFDMFFPDLIEIGDEAVIGYNSTVLTHEFLQGEWRRGRTKIGGHVMLGANSTVLAGVKIGEGATVSAMSLVNSDIPPRSFYGGVPAKRLKQRNGQ